MRMKNPHTGLYEFCLQLGRSLVQNVADDEKISFYLHPKTGQAIRKYQRLLQSK